MRFARPTRQVPFQSTAKTVTPLYLPTTLALAVLKLDAHALRMITSSSTESVSINPVFSEIDQFGYER